MHPQPIKSWRKKHPLLRSTFLCLKGLLEGRTLFKRRLLRLKRDAIHQTSRLSFLYIYIYISSWYGFFLPHHYIITSLINFSNKFRMAFLRLSDAPLLARPPLQPTDREMQGDEASDSHDIKKQLPTLQLLTYTCMLSVCRRNIHIYIGMCMIYDICIV